MDWSILRTHARNLTIVAACVAFACMLACAAQPADAYAASNLNVALESGKTYSSYDVTGDGKADTVRITLSGKNYDYYKRAYINVNGKRAYTLTWDDGDFYVASAKVMRMQNGNVFLYVHASSDNDDGPDYVLKWKSGKFVRVLDCDYFANWIGCNHTYTEAIIANGNRISIKHSVMSSGVGGIYAAYSYKYSGGELVRTSATSNNVKLWKAKTVTANKILQLYGNAKCTNGAGKLAKGKRATIKKIYVTKSRCSLKLAGFGDASGWMKIPKRLSGWTQASWLFKEAWYAG